MTSTLYAGLINRRAIIDRKHEVHALEQALANKATPLEKRQAVVMVLKAALKRGRNTLKARLLQLPVHEKTAAPDPTGLPDPTGFDADLDRNGVKNQNKASLSGVSRGLGVSQGLGPSYARGYAFLIDQLVRLLFDTLTQRIYPTLNPTMGERITLIAVGGYGRGELAPFSDIDLLFLTPYKQTSWGEQVIEAMLYALWDMGLKVGHATRSMDDLLRMANTDLTVRTAFLEARYLWGDDALYDKAQAAFRSQIVQGTTPQFVAEKLQERDVRHKKMGDSRYVVEPNLKEGKGGLRDLQTLLWIARYVHPINTVQDLVHIGLFTPEELQVFLRAYRFLWTVRCQLHVLTNRAEERLTFDVQPELARRLGYTDRPGLRGVERFMKHYFLIAKQVGALTAQFLAHLEETHRKKPLFRLPTITRKPSKLNGFTLTGGRLSIPDADFFKQKPIRLLELFHLCELHQLDIHPTAMRQAGRDCDLIKAALRNDPHANALFLEILTSPHKPEERLRAMNEAGIFGRFIPDFGRVVAQMQYDMYHHYTVDEHTIRAIGLLSAIEKGMLQADHPIATQIVPHLSSRRALYVAVLLHDIAKGRGGDHSVIGEEIAFSLCPRLGLSDAETQTVAWLVRWHLLMSATAFKRDLSDFKTILDFAEQVQSPERLRMLLVLTVVDIRAVGPGVWNSWKGQLLRDLYQATQEVLIAGHKQSGRRERIASQQHMLSEHLAWPADQFDWYARRFFDSYWIAEPLPTLALNAQMIRQADKDKRSLALAHAEERARGATLLCVYTDDHPGLFSRLSGALALAGANILDAKVHTLRDGRALDNFVIQDQTGAAIVEPERLSRLYSTIEDALLGRIRLSDRLAAKPLQRPRAQAFRFAPVVIIDNNLSNRFSVIEVSALDKPALLFSLTTALYQSKITIHSAHIATYGERAVDTFYVTDLTGEKISNTNRLRALERRLAGAASFEAGGVGLAKEPGEAA